MNIYKLDNGEEINLAEAMKRGLTRDQAYYRLKTKGYTSLEKVFGEKKRAKPKPKVKKKRVEDYLYPLDDGTSISAKELAKQLNMTTGGATRRLQLHTDPVKVFKKSKFKKRVKRKDKVEVITKPKEKSRWPNINKDVMAAKPIYDPMYRLMLKTI